MPRPAILEAFDLEGPSIPAPVGPSEDWLDGHATGLSEARAMQERGQAALSEEIVTAVQGLAQERAIIAEAQLGQLTQMFEALVGSFFPLLSASAMVPIVVEELTALAEQELAQPLSLRSNPTQHSALVSALPPHLQTTVLCREDPTLSERQVLLTSNQEQRLVDLDKLLSETRSALQALWPHTSVEAAHE